MSKFNKCIDISVEAGKVSKQIGEQIKAADDPETAIDTLLGELSRQRREAAIQAVRLSEAWEKINSYPVDKKGKKQLYNGLIALLTKDPTGRAGYGNVEYLQKFYSGKYDSKFAKALSRFRTRKLGFSQDQEGLTDLTRAIYGEPTNDPQIKQFAEDWAKLTEELRQEFNAKGGSVSKNEKWLLPQNHDARAIEKMGLEKWKQKILPMLDRDQMTDDLGNRMSDADFDEALNYTFETITSGGLNKTKDFTSKPKMGAKLSRKGAEKRFLFFKNADAWLEYQKDFGKGDIFTSLTDYIDGRTNDIATMELLGTNPETTFNALKQQIKKTEGMTPRQSRFSEMIFNVATGKVNQGELTTLADVMSVTRNVLVASTLGKAFLSAFSDVGFQAITARFNNIPAFKVLSRQMSLMKPGNEADRIFAVRMGLIAEQWKGRATAANRYADVYGTGFSTKMAEGVMRASLLAPWTDAGRKAFGMEFGAVLADNFSKSIDELDPNLKRAFDNYGIGAADWDVFRKQKPLDFQGAKFADMTQDAGKKFHQMVLSETDFAVPTPDAKVRAITTGGLGRASVAGQAWRSAMMLKSFPITILTTHFYRAATQATLGEKLAYVGTLAATTTILGGVAIQAKDLAAGREPRDPMTGQFFAAAFQQGGGIGLLGDFMFSDVNRFGGGITETLTGPTGQLANTAFKFTIGNIQEAVKGEETNILGEAAQIVDRYTPDIWQTHLFKNALFDQIEVMANPKTPRRFNRIMRKRKKDYKQGYWWEPGSPLPEALK